MPTTYVLIDKYTVGSTSQASITFSSIPQTYKHLVLHFSGRNLRSGSIDGSEIYFNGDTDLSKNSQRRFYGNGSGIIGDTTRGGQLFVTASGALASTFGNSTLYLPDYTNSSYRKSWIWFSSQEDSTSTAYIGQGVAGTTITAAISSITIRPETSNDFVEHTEAHLYGLG